MFALAGLQAEVADALSAAVKKAMESQPIRDKLQELGAEPRSGSANELAEILAKDTTVWGGVIRSAGVTTQ